MIRFSAFVAHYARFAAVARLTLVRALVERSHAAAGFAVALLQFAAPSNAHWITGWCERCMLFTRGTQLTLHPVTGDMRFAHFTAVWFAFAFARTV